MAPDVLNTAAQLAGSGGTACALCGGPACLSRVLGVLVFTWEGVGHRFSVKIRRDPDFVENPSLVLPRLARIRA